jgi:glycosyltransferase involved in cell wall biosynthesis
MKIWVHTLVRNEERYLWFAVASVVNHVDKVLLWDTGSTDNTVKIVYELKKKFGEKIDFKEVGEVDKNKFTEVRQKMLEVTKSDWFMILDGDEVWWSQEISRAVGFIKKHKDEYEMLVNRNYNVVGDIFHFQEEIAGRYLIDEESGHLNIRLVNRNIPGLHFERPHGKQGLYDGKMKLIQKRTHKKRKHLGYGYLHFTNMTRSKNQEWDLRVMKRDIKTKYELGSSFEKDFYYPEVFFEPRPLIVNSPWFLRSKKYLLKAYLQTPIKYIKRRLFVGKSGY